MKVTAIAAGTSTLTVIRNVAPNCLGYFNENGVAAAANSIVTLLQPVFDTVQLVDSVTKQATQAAGADGNPVSSGSCAMVSLKVAEANDGGFTVTDNVLTFDGGKLTIAQGSITEAAPGVFTSTAHGLSVGDAVTYYSNGGTSIDVLTNGATYYVTATTFAANTFTLATTRGGTALTVGNDGNDLQFFAKTATPAAGSLAGNQGRSAFGTGVPGTGKAHAASGDCHVYEYKGGAGQATEPTRDGFGHTTIYDPRVSIRQIKKVASSTSLLLGAKADTLTKTGSEPANVIGDPHEPFENGNPVRSGTDYRCPVVAGKVSGWTTATGVSAADSIVRIDGAFLATDTVLKIQVKDTALPTASVDLVVGDYIRK